MKKSNMKKILLIGAVATVAAATTAIIIAKQHKHKVLLKEHTKMLLRKNAYITGGGLSALASALYLVRDCGLSPSNVHVFADTSHNCGNSESGYICRRGKIVDENSSMNLFDLLKDVSSLDIPDLTVCDEILNIYRANSISRNITFIDDDSNVIDISKISISKKHRQSVLSLIQTKPENLRGVSIYESLPDDFFTTPFWKLMSAAYGFSKNSSAFEFVNCICHTDNMLTGTMPNDFDEYEEIIEPLKEHLKKLGVDIRERAVVTDIDFTNKKADAIHFTDNGVRKTYYLNDGDICIMPTDEVAYNESFGDFNTPAPKLFVNPYQLWENLYEKNSISHDPSLFFDEFDEDMIQEFTITLSNKLFPELINKVTCGALGTNGVIVLDNSNWKFSICAVPATHFKNHNEDSAIIWGSASCFERDGKWIDKPMSECSGEEILHELVSCFNLDEVWDDIRETVVNVIPCLRKYGKSLLSPVNSKLEIIPTGLENFAISGDFADFKGCTVFSEEYAVSTARTATYKLMNSRRKMFTPKHNSMRDMKNGLKKLS